MRWTVRDATTADAEALGVVHVRAWQVAYRGVFTDAYLDGLDVNERANGWRERLKTRETKVRSLVACDEATASLVGFASIGPDRDGLGVGELYAINIHPGAWGKGAGRALFDAATKALAEAGHAEAVLWVVRSNARARRFYEVAGWRPDGAEATRVVLGATADEVRYRTQLSPMTP